MRGYLCVDSQLPPKGTCSFFCSSRLQLLQMLKLCYLKLGITCIYILLFRSSFFFFFLFLGVDYCHYIFAWPLLILVLTDQRSTSGKKFSSFRRWIIGRCSFFLFQIYYCHYDYHKQQQVLKQLAIIEDNL